MKIIKNLSWIFFANIFSALGKWLIIILIANRLSPVEVGVYSLAFAVSAPIILFGNMKLRSLYITREENIEDYILIRYFMSLVVLFLLSVISYIFYNQYFIIVFLVGLAKILDLQSDIFYAVPHKKNKLEIIGKIMICKQLCILIGFSYVLYFWGNLTLALLTQIFIQVLFVIFIEKKLIYTFKFLTIKKVNMVSFKKILWLGVPLGLVQMIFSANVNIPRYVLEYFEGPKVLGFFSAIMYIITVSNLFMNSVSQVFLPKISRLYKDKNYKKIKEITYIYLSSTALVLGFLMIILTYYFGETLLRIIYGVEYAEYSQVLLVVSISNAIGLLSWNFDTALMGINYITIQLKIVIIVLLLSLPVSIFLISSYGIVGAAFSLAILSFIQLVLRLLFFNIRIKSLIENTEKVIG
ncbi:hypothetical protein BBI15_07550 [Planococcus plakortidis]|uniref:Polysaccharide biosynthesis protein C-terminal domain-containing protein n=1 Tax=Planococcus plakortidis TaxID=1038856 RepID=A0A1C7E8M3_9BACL|nr:oligosaccharide flippase family protein [Planococcus plakortidis]ANU20079.1 hypothetical protein BBI15_07550 [Planococcus plakortidis]